MILRLIDITILIVSSCIIMILHELTKSITYTFINRNQKNNLKHIFKIGQYIDPIGLIFSITCYSGFSKPYMYRIKDKKTNLILGVVGFTTLLVLFLVNASLIYIFFNQMLFENGKILEADNIATYIQFEFLLYTSLLSLSMFIVNLFPVSTFDMALIIASQSPSKYFSLIQKDDVVKLITMAAIALQIVNSLSRLVIQTILYGGL